MPRSSAWPIEGRKSFDIVQQGLKILENPGSPRRGGRRQADGRRRGHPDPSRCVFRAEMSAQGVTLPPPGEWRGHDLLPKETRQPHGLRARAERAVKAEGQVLLGWRDVPSEPRDADVAHGARKEPVIRQIFIGRGPDILAPDALERKLYVIRKTASSAIQAPEARRQPRVPFFVPSMSCRTIIYKGPAVGHAGRQLTGTCRPASSRPWPSCTSASPPTPSDLAAGPPLPHGGAQRRDQHGGRNSTGCAPKRAIRRCSATT